jgi:tetratricopeptide (TPR) repeat protein
VAKNPVKDLEQSVLLLLQEAMHNQALLVLRSGLKHIQTQQDHECFAALLEQFPATIKTTSQEHRRLCIYALGAQQKYPEMQQYLETQQHLAPQDFAELRLEYALCLADQRLFAQATQMLYSLTDHLENEALGRALAGLGYCCFEQKQPWELHFVRCQTWLRGLALARALVNYGYCLYQDGQLHKARSLWTQALPLVKDRIKTTAHLLGNLALVNQELFDIEAAEAHYLQLERLSRKPQAAMHRANAWRGIANMRRFQGEWARAESAYQKALELATDDFDRSAAHRGLARLHLLSGRAGKALELLEYALSEFPEYSDALQGAKARTLLALGNQNEAKALLDGLPARHNYTDHWLLEMSRAEIARREGQFETALNHLAKLPLETFLVREEAMRFPELMALLESRGQKTPEPLRYHKNLVVQVKATGVLQVFVNQRQLHIPPTGKVAELLVFLLEHGGSASSEQICDALYPDSEFNQAKKNLWNIADVLEKTLGWENSIKNLRNAYRLDPTADWQYDIAKARAKKQAVPEFLAGIYSEWALEVAARLEGDGLEKRLA